MKYSVRVTSKVSAVVPVDASSPEKAIEKATQRVERLLEDSLVSGVSFSYPVAERCDTREGD
jgi:hypothetical protein